MAELHTRVSDAVSTATNFREGKAAIERLASQDTDRGSDIAGLRADLVTLRSEAIDLRERVKVAEQAKLHAETTLQAEHAATTEARTALAR